RPQPYHGASAKAVGFPITLAWHGRQVMIEQRRTVTDKPCLAGFTAEQSAKITDTAVIGWYFHAALKIVALEHGLPIVFVFDPTLFPDTPLQYSRDWMEGIERMLSPSGEVSPHNERYFSGNVGFMEHVDASRAGILPPLAKPSWQHAAIEPEYAYDPCMVHAPVWMHLRSPEERTERMAGIEDVLAAGRAVESLLQIRRFSQSIEQSALGL
ncbi:MAG: hypothetical protein J0L97_10555, partial [Alphaproteobacteria bacterium]|nr:hypothetical protein [Alphaproteobacteria bacterium]